MNTYDTLSQAVDALQKDGFDFDFKVQFDRLKCQQDQSVYQPQDFEIEQVHRFEGMSDPGDSSVVYAIHASDGKKGLLIDAYGADSDPVSIEMIDKLKMPNRSKL